jgi:hypothetical protein
MNRPICPPEENVVRAICSDHYDSEEERISASLFKGKDTSVSRLLLISLEDHWDLFRHNVQKPHRRLELIGEISVGRLQEIGRAYEPAPMELTVEQAPEDWNRAHAVIPQNITRGLANKILPALKLHKPI